MTSKSILLVDDEPEVLLALKLRLGSEFEVYTSSNPEQALELVRQKGPFPVIMSDLRMPRMNGLQFLREVQKINPETSTILLTGQGEFQNAVEALNSGKIFKYLSKPCQKIKITEALEEGISHFNDATEKTLALREYNKENKIAEIVQEQLLHTSLVPDEKIDFAAHSSPKRYVSGDFFEVIPYNNGSFDVILADVMGKGLPAAIIGAATKNVILQQSHYLSLKNQSSPPLNELVSAIDREIFPKLVEARMFITMFVIRVDVKKNKISYISCGHPGGILKKGNSSEVEYLTGLNMPIGITPENDYQVIEVDFQVNDFLILYTDGIVEALQKWTQVDPVKVLLDCLDGTEKSSQDVVDHIFTQAAAIEGDKDDMAILSIKFKPENKGKDAKKHYWLQSNLNEIYRLHKIIDNSTAEADEMFKVAVIETFSNIVKHSNKANSAIKIFTKKDDHNRLIILFAYHGSPFQPDKIKIPDCSSQKDGFGLFLVEKICHKAEYSTASNGVNHITLVAKKGK